MKRDQNVRVLFSDDEKLMLEYLAKRRGLTLSDVVRQLVREASR